MNLRTYPHCTVGSQPGRMAHMYRSIPTFRGCLRAPHALAKSHAACIDLKSFFHFENDFGVGEKVQEKMKHRCSRQGSIGKPARRPPVHSLAAKLSGNQRPHRCLKNNVKLSPMLRCCGWRSSRDDSGGVGRLIGALCRSTQCARQSTLADTGQVYRGPVVVGTSSGWPEGRWGCQGFSAAARGV